MFGLLTNRVYYGIIERLEKIKLGGKTLIILMVTEFMTMAEAMVKDTLVDLYGNENVIVLSTHQICKYLGTDKGIQYCGFGVVAMHSPKSELALRGFFAKHSYNQKKLLIVLHESCRMPPMDLGHNDSLILSQWDSLGLCQIFEEMFGPTTVQRSNSLHFAGSFPTGPHGYLYNPERIH